MTSLVDILLLLTNTGAVSEFLMIQHMKNLQGMYNPKSDSHTLSLPVRGQARFRPHSPLLVVRGDDIGPLYGATTSVLCTGRRHRSFVRGDDIGPLVESSKTEAYNHIKGFSWKESFLLKGTKRLSMSCSSIIEVVNLDP